MAKTVQILLLLLVAVTVQSYGGRRYFRGRSHGRYRNPYDYYHHRRYSGERPHVHSNKHHQMNSHNPGDLSDSSHIERQPALPDEHNVEDLESTTATDSPMSGPSSVDNSNPDSDDSVPDSGVDSPGSDKNDKPDDVSNVIENGEPSDSMNSDKPDDDIHVKENGKTPNVEDPDNINGNEPLSEENPDNTIDVNGISPGGDEDNLDPGDNSSAGNLNENQPDILENPQDSIVVNGLEPDDNEGSSLNESPNGENGYLNNDTKFPEDKNKLEHDYNNIDNGELQPNGNDGDIKVDGLSPGEDSDGDEDNSSYGSVDVNGLSPGGDNSKSDDDNININGLSPGGDAADGPGINVHGGLSNNVLGKPNHNNIVVHGPKPDNHNHKKSATNNADISGNNDGFPSGHGSIGAHVDLPNKSGHIDLGGPLLKPSGNIIDHGGLNPELKPNFSGNIDSHFMQPVSDPDMEHPHPSDGNESHLDVEQPQIHPISPGDDILPNPGDSIPHIPISGAHEKPDEVLSTKLPGLEDNNEDKKNNSMMIPVLLPGGGHIMIHADALGNIPSYIIVKINGQPTLIQNSAGIGVGGVNTGSLDLSNLIFGNNVQPVGGIGGVLPSWINLGGVAGNGGVSIGSGGNIGILPNTQPIWISSQLPNFGGGGGAGGTFIIPNNEPIQPVPVPVPIPRPMPPPRPIYPTPQPIPIPEPIDPGFSINPYPGFPWPSNWTPNNPNVNVNVTHMPLTPNQGSNIDWTSLFDILENIDSRLPKPQPPRPNEPTPQPNYPLYPQYPYIYPPPMPYPLYPYLSDYLYPKPTGPGKNIPDDEENLGEKDTSNPREPTPQPEEPHPVPLPEELHPVPLPEESHPVPLPEETHPEPLPEETHPEPLPEVPRPEPLSEELRPEPQPEEPHPLPLPEETQPVSITEEPSPAPLPEEPRPGPFPEKVYPVPLPIEPHPTRLPEEPRPDLLPEEPHTAPLPEEPHSVPLPEEPYPGLLPEEPHPMPLPEEPRPTSLPEEPHPVPHPEEHRPAPLPEELHPVPHPEEHWPAPLPEEPHPVPHPEEHRPAPLPEEPRPVPLPEELRPVPLPEESRPEPLPEEPRPVPLPEESRPEPLPEEPRPVPLPEESRPEPLPEEPRPTILPEEPRPVPLPEESHPTPLPEEPHPVPGSDVNVEPHKENTLTPHPKPHPEHPDHHHHDKPVINLPDIHITLPKPTHIGKPKPGHPDLDSGLIDILNVLFKFPDRNSHPPKNVGSLIKLLLTILKPGKKQPLVPNHDNNINGQPDLENLSHLLLHLLDGRKEPNLNVLIEPGMDEGTRANLILLLQLLTNNLGVNSYPMGYYQPENPLLYFLGHFPCDHPNIPAISGMQPSSSNLWQLLESMYGHNYDQEFRLERSAEQDDADDKSAGEVKNTEIN